MILEVTPQQLFTVSMVARMLPQHSHVLSTFERDLADEVVQRFLAPDEFYTSDAEWPVLEEIAQLMANDRARLGKPS